MAAIDFGNACSGYSYAMKSMIEKNPPIIFAPIWFDSFGKLISRKTSTTVLLNKAKQLVAFGFEAEFKYAELLADGYDEHYFYFRHFKMMLDDQAKSKVIQTKYT